MKNATDLILFTKHLYYLTRMNAPLGETLLRVKEEMKNREMREAVDETLQGVKKGGSLSAGMKKRGRIFPADYVRLIEAAEASDTLPQTLKNLAGYLEEMERFSKALKNGILYPALILDVAVLFLAVMRLYVNEPLLAALRETPGVLSPLLGMFFSPVFLLVFAFLTAILNYLIFSDISLGTSHLYYVPVVGFVIRKAHLVRISRSMHMMMSSGVTLAEALEKAALIMEAPPLARALLSVREQVARGKSLSDAIREQPAFPFLFHWIIRNGEEVEDLTGAFADAASSFEKDMRDIIQYFEFLAEPMCLLGIGAFVGLMLTAYWVPIYAAIQNL
jgi:type II secretory pathway component PulF